MSRLGGLRARLTLLVTCAVAASLAAAFAVVYGSTSSQLRARTDRDLRQDMKQLRAAVLAGKDGDAFQRARSYVDRAPFRATSRLLFVAVPGRRPVTNQPELLEVDNRSGEGGLRSHERREARDAARRFLAASPGFSRESIPDAGTIRLLVERRRGDGGPIRLGVGAPVEPADQARDDVRNAFLVAAAVGLLGALAGGFLVASRVAAPLRRMAAVAARVDAGDLGRRMDERGRRDEVHVLARSFDHMLERLQDAFDRQGSFVADASHELRTPLTVIRGQLEVLGMEEDPSAAEVRRVERLVRTEIDRMARLVDDLLLLARAGEDGFLRLERIDLPVFLGEVVDGIRPTVDRRLVLEDVPEAVLYADPDRLAQALRNLLRNAIDHTEPGGLVTLSCHVDRDRVQLVVDDDGPGIPPGERARVLNRFHRLDSDRGPGDSGAGLGLSIVQAIVSAHGGTLDIGDAPTGGARMEMSLPREPPPTRR